MGRGLFSKSRACADMDSVESKREGIGEYQKFCADCAHKKQEEIINGKQNATYDLGQGWHQTCAESVF